MDRICKRLTILVLFGLTIGGVSSSIVLANTKPVETKAVEAEQSNATKTEDATIITYKDNSGWCYRSLNVYSVSYATGYSYTDFENFLTVYYGEKISSWVIQGTTRGWGLNKGKAQEYMICDGGDQTTHNFELPKWVTAFTFQIVNDNNWLCNWGVHSSWGYHCKFDLDINGTTVKTNSMDPTTFDFPAITISKQAIDEDGNLMQDPVLSSETSVIFDKYPDSGDKPSDPPSISKMTFDDWYLDTAFQTKFAKKAYNTDTTIYAKYNFQTYTVQFDAGGGGGSMESLTSRLGTAITLPDPTGKITRPASHCSFDCWVDSNQNEYKIGDTFSPYDAGTYTMTAKWKTSAQVSINDGSALNMTWDSANKQAKLENLALASGDSIKFIISDISITYEDGVPTNLYNHRIKKPGSSLGLYLKENDGSYVAYASGLDDAPYSRELVVNNVFYDTIQDISNPNQHYKLAVSLNANDRIKLSYKYCTVPTYAPYNVEYLETSFGANGKFEIDANGLVCKETNSYDVYIKKNSDSEQWATVWIQYHDMESEALAYADYFLNKLSTICKEDGSTVVSELESAWSQEGDTSLSAKFSSLLADAQKYLREFSSETPAKIVACINKYDFIMTKYNATYSKTITNFMGRTVKSPQPIGPQPINPNSKVNGFIILASVIGASTLLATGVFVAKKTSKNKKKTHK